MDAYTLIAHITAHGLVVEGDESLPELREAHSWLHAGEPMAEHLEEDYR